MYCPVWIIRNAKLGLKHMSAFGSIVLLWSHSLVEEWHHDGDVEGVARRQADPLLHRGGVHPDPLGRHPVVILRVQMQRVLHLLPDSRPHLPVIRLLPFPISVSCEKKICVKKNYEKILLVNTEVNIFITELRSLIYLYWWGKTMKKHSSDLQSIHCVDNSLDELLKAVKLTE